MADPTETSQLVIIHLSDLHFGRNHRFSHPLTARGDRPSNDSQPTLLEKLEEDLRRPDPRCPVLICITGDIAETADPTEFREAEKFIEALASVPIFGLRRGKESVFVVPGNHDVKYDSPDIGIRWQQWADFHRRAFGSNIRDEDPWSFATVHDSYDSHKAVVVSLNTSIYVEKNKPDEDRGHLDYKQLENVEKALEELSQSQPEKFARSIRIALMHHHPVLIPSLVEPGKGYDAVHNSAFLLNLLKRYGFHCILHGHKHNPHSFSEDAKSAFQAGAEYPILVAAGGSVGSTQLPVSPNSKNCYNIVTVKWHASGHQSRIRVETRGLATFDENGVERLPPRWTWESLRTDDRHFYAFDHAPVPCEAEDTIRDFDQQIDKEGESRRQQEYERTRGNFPVVEIRPSLSPEQAYEALLWIVRHSYDGAELERDRPTEVKWSAGARFEVINVKSDDDEHFCASLAYWGPMLVQAELTFPDGYQAQVYAYARMPIAYVRPSVD